jgi:hypothetical protein
LTTSPNAPSWSSCPSRFLDDMPVYKVCAFSEGKFAEERLEGILKQVQ